MPSGAGLSAVYGAAVDLALEPEAGRAFPRDPEAFAAARGLGLADRRAFRRFAPRLGVYRQLIRTTLVDPVEDCFPICRALLRSDDAWTDCLDAFLASRAIRSPYFRDIAPAFVQWLADAGWGGDRWPFLLALAHWEYLELELLRWPDEPVPPGLAPAPEPGSRVAFDPAARLLRYAWQVQDATVEAPRPAAGDVHLLAYRDRDLDFAWRQLSAPGSAFLVRLQQGAAVGAAAEALGLDLAEALDLLVDLRGQGALLSFR